MSRMLVTGGAGFIGSHLVERLLELGHTVRVLDNFSTGRRENLRPFLSSIELLETDVRSESALRSAVEGVEVVFHQAAMASVQRSVDDPVTSNEVNVFGTLNVLLTSRDAGVRRVVYASSSSIYGNAEGLPKREDMAPAPESPYAVGKLAGEHYCRVFSALYGLDCVPLRYFNVFGPRQDPSSQYAAVVPIFVAALLRGAPPVVYGDGEQSRDFTYVSNVVDANILASASERGVGEVVNVACGATVTVNELLRKLKALVGASVDARYAEGRPGDVKHSFADISKARDLLGFRPRVPFEDGLALTVEWYRKESLRGAS
jgi:nucleoside-diphosphate-sugar epimerase